MDELSRVKSERDFYLNKLMRVKQKLTEGRKTTPQQQSRKQTTPKSVKSKKSKSHSGLKSINGSIRSRSASKSAASNRKSDCANLNIRTSAERIREIEHAKRMVN